MSKYIIHHFALGDSSKPVSMTEFDYNEDDKQYEEFTVVCEFDNQRVPLVYRSDFYLKVEKRKANIGLLSVSILVISIFIVALLFYLNNQYVRSLVSATLSIVFLEVSSRYLLSDIKDFEKNVTLKGYFDEIHEIKKIS